MPDEPVTDVTASGVPPSVPRSVSPSVSRRWSAALVRAGREARRDRITGIAAEVAFFVLLSLPPTILILAGTAGYVAGFLGDSRADLQREIVEGLARFLSPETIDDLIRPAVMTLFDQGRLDVISLGALVALWSSSRMIKVLIEGLNVAYGVPEWRRPWRRRLAALGLTVAGIVVLAVVLPFFAAGPDLGRAMAERTGMPSAVGTAWRALYWPVAVATGVALLASLYHAAPNRRMRWRADLPGAIVATGLWVGSAFGLRVYVRAAISEATFGPLAAPAVLMLWLYVSALAVLFGAELNAALLEEHSPHPSAAG